MTRAAAAAAVLQPSKYTTLVGIAVQCVVSILAGHGKDASPLPMGHGNARHIMPGRTHRGTAWRMRTLIRTREWAGDTLQLCPLDRSGTP